MKSSVVQEETTGCGIAAVANLAGTTYAEMKSIANSLGIYANDQVLWSSTDYVRTLLNHSGISTSKNEVPFESWNSLPDLALLSIKHHIETGKAYWHWVVFTRSNQEMFVLDSASYLKSNIRTDFNEMQPKWFIEIYSS